MFEWLSLSTMYTIVKDGIASLTKARSKNKPNLSKAEIVNTRQEWKQTFEPFVWEKKQSGHTTDAIIRDVSRVDDYPEVDKKRKGISPWFRVGLMDTYDKGLKVGLHWESLIYLDDREAWVYADRAKDKQSEITKAILIGYIPFEYIVNVDWRGDEYYNMPHIYCYFASRKKEPYEGFEYCIELTVPPLSTPHYSKISSLGTVRNNSKKIGRKSPYFR